MASDIPISDVLCEAVDYLFKHGSILRSRTESLKEKRITKAKLKNAHAIQKGANKILQICELSKKSLDNVEMTIRKVLSSVESSQSHSDVGGKSSTLKKYVDEYRFQFFEFDSYKLKISRKVPLKHYMSVKVLAKNMSISLLEKYPVYCNCKLYQQRMKQSWEKLIQKREKTETSNDSKIIDKNSSNTSSCIVENKFNNSEVSKELGKTCFSYDIANAHEYNNEELEGNKNGLTPVSTDDVDREINRHVDNEKKELEYNENSSIPAPSIVSDVPVTEISDSETGNKYVENAEFNSTINSLKKCVTTTDSEKSKNKENCDITKLNLDFSKTKIHNCNKVKDRSNRKNDAKKRFKHLKIMPDSSESDCEKRKDSDSDTKDQNQSYNVKDTGKCSGSSNEKLVGSDAHSDKEKATSHCVECNTQTKGVEMGMYDAKNCDEIQKPLIKCVNISKLLKPDIFEKSEEKFTGQYENADVNKVGIHKSKTSMFEKTSQPASKTKPKLKTNSSDEELTSKHNDQYWTLKRKEVSTFISKHFSINVTRLPELDTSFLQSHKLKRIINKGSVLCQIQNEYEQNVDAVNNKRENSTSKDEHKNALLNVTDSDGDNSDIPVRELSPVTKNVKEALLKDSDSDKTEKKNYQNSKSSYAASDKDTNKVKGDKLLKAHQKEQYKDEDIDNKIIEEVNKTKNLLLNETDSDLDSNKRYEMASKPEVNENSEILNKHTELCSLNPETVVENDVDNEIDKASSSSPLLLRYSSTSDGVPKTPLSQRRKCKVSTPRSRRKHIMESMHAKKMLLTYSSSSETEDEQLRNVLREIKNELLKGVSSEEDDIVSKHRRKHPRKRSLQSSSSEDVVEKVKKKMQCDSSEETSETGKLKYPPSEETSENDTKIVKDDVQITETIDQVDGAMDDQSNSSSSKVRYF